MDNFTSTKRGPYKRTPVYRFMSKSATSLSQVQQTHRLSTHGNISAVSVLSPFRAAFSAERWRLYFDVAGLRKQGKEGIRVQRPNERETGEASTTCFVPSSLLVPRPPPKRQLGADQTGQRKLPSERKSSQEQTSFKLVHRSILVINKSK